MEEARHLAAQCWCDEETKSFEINTLLAEAVAKRIAAWMEASAAAYKDASFYRDLLVRCGDAFGEEAYICDDGSRSQDVLALNVPPLVEAICFRMKSLEK